MKIPTVTFDPKDQWKKLPDRPFCLKNGKAIYRYGNRYNVITDEKGKTELIDLAASSGKLFLGEIELNEEGRKKTVIINSKEYSLSEILQSEKDL